jgi:hypothetical protein
MYAWNHEIGEIHKIAENIFSVALNRATLPFAQTRD